MTRRLEQIPCGHPVPTTEWFIGIHDWKNGYRWRNHAFCGVCQRNFVIRVKTKPKPWWRRIRVKIYLKGEDEDEAGGKGTTASG